MMLTVSRNCQGRGVGEGFGGNALILTQAACSLCDLWMKLRQSEHQTRVESVTCMKIRNALVH